MKIVVCDDSREDRGALRELQEACEHDFEVREYGSGAELYANMGYVWINTGMILPFPVTQKSSRR